MKSKKIMIAWYLSIRIVLMLVFQGLTMLFLLHLEHPLVQSGYYWAIHITLLNLIILIWLMQVSKRSGSHYLSFFKKFNKKDTFLFFLLLPLIAVLALLPNFLLAQLIYQDPLIGTTFLIGDIPLGFMIINLTLFPILQGFVEIPFYFSFLSQKIKEQSNKKIFYLVYQFCF
jgi:hypothetical protein